MRNDFAAFILTHGRANNVKTLKTLKKQGYTGKWYVVIDNEDEQESEYRKNFGEHVLQFDKLAISKTFDTADQSENRKTIVYARNACFELAKQVGCRYFLELDDDYIVFQKRFIEGNKLREIEIKDLDSAFEAMIDFLIASKAKSVAFAQGGDFIGGAQGTNAKKGLLRKAMNTFFCDAENPFTFVGRINEDVNTYTSLGSRGDLFFTVCGISIMQTNTQKAKGGMTDVYIDGGTYLKSFYTVMFQPSSVKVQMMGDKNKRMHHNIQWNNTVPMILNERWKKNV